MSTPEKPWPPARVVGGTPINTPGTMQCYLLARELEQLPAHPDATALSSAAWRLLDELGKYHAVHGIKA